MTVILASTSTIRRQLLENAGIMVVTQKPFADEAKLKRAAAALAPQALAQHLASAKCISVSTRHKEKLVIGADQVLSFAGRTYDKPGNRDEAHSQLKALRGRTHTLVTAVCCARGGEIVWQHSDRAELTMRAFSDSFLESYLVRMGADITNSVGAYKLEGQGIQLFEHIQGDYFTILGLPLLPLLEFLRSTGEAES